MENEEAADDGHPPTYHAYSGEPSMSFSRAAPEDAFRRTVKATTNTRPMKTSTDTTTTTVEPTTPIPGADADAPAADSGEVGRVVGGGRVVA